MSDATLSSDEEQVLAQDVPRDPATLRVLNPRRILFEPVIGRVVDALGGHEAGVYQTLEKRRHRRRTHRARIFWEKRVLMNDLIPILLLTAGAGQVEDKRAISCADLMSAMTWPIDMAEELAELDPDERAEFTQLHQSHRAYKAAILQPAVMSALFGLLLPPLAKARRERTLRDNQVAALVLHIVRNLAAIRDSEGLQSRLLRALQETHLADLLLTAASNATPIPFSAAGTRSAAKARPPAPPCAEARTAPPPTSRHSRFGTTITVQSKTLKTSVKALVHTTAPTALLLDAGKRPVRVRALPAAEAALADDLTPKHAVALLKDIRMERAWATGDRVAMMVLAVARWTIAFFLLDNKDSKEKREFGRVGAAAESGFVSWVLKRMREATEEKPKGWATIYAGMGCLTQILLLLDGISSSTSEADEADAEAAQTLTMQLIYAGAPLDLALDCLRVCSAATATGRGPAFLDAAVHFAYAVVRMLERGGSGGEAVYVPPRKEACKEGRDDADDAADDERKRQEARETTFSLEAFEMKFATAEITRALLLQLARFKELATEPEVLRRVVSTLYLFQTILAAQKTFPRDQPHRDLVQLVTFILRKFFKALEEQPFLAVEAFFPKNRGHWKAYSSWEPPEKEKSVRERARAEKPGAGEVQVKRGFSWSEQLGIVIAALVDEGNVQWVNWTEDVSAPPTHRIFVTLTIPSLLQILKTVLAQWEKIAKEVDAAAKARADGASENEEEEEVLAKRMEAQLETPSAEMREKMVDFLIPYLSDEEANAASRNPQVKLLWRLAKFTLMPEEPDAADLECQADGPRRKKASDLLTKTRRARRARSPSPDSDADADASGDGGVNSDSDADAPKKRKKRKEKEKKEPPKKPDFKSAQFIEDSDEEYGDIDAFLEKEKEMREKLAREAAEKGITIVQPAGTKKRRKKEAPAGEGTSKRKKKRRSSSTAAEGGDGAAESEADVFGSRPVVTPEESTPAVRPRPRPKPRHKPKNAEAGTSSPDTVLKSSEMDEDVRDVVPAGPADSDEEGMEALSRRKKKRLVISDEDD
ncbi:timeless protein-domain-containing protein [Mycena galopus ATCC 62051]|nr:timeless protein-domain-containing protein [Mycena galopus ATCC 62051]